MYPNSKDVIEDAVSSDVSSEDQIYANKNNLFMNGRDEIMPANTEGSCDTSSINTIVMHANQKARKVKINMRENNARRFLDHLGKVKSKVFKKRLTLQDYYEHTKPYIAEMAINGGGVPPVINSVNATDSLAQGSTRDFEEDPLVKLEEVEDYKAYPQIREFEKPMQKSARRKNRTKRQDLAISYDDMNRKDNYIFFEIFAFYADNYLEKENKQKTKKIKKVLKRSVSKLSREPIKTTIYP